MRSGRVPGVKVTPSFAKQAVNSGLLKPPPGLLPPLPPVIEGLVDGVTPLGDLTVVLELPFVLVVPEVEEVEVGICGEPKPEVFVTLVVSPALSDEACVGSSNLIVTSPLATFETVPVTRGPPPPNPPPPEIAAPADADPLPVPRVRPVANPPPPNPPAANPLRFKDKPVAEVVVAL